MAIEQWTTATSPHVAMFIDSNFTNDTRRLGGQLIPSGYIYSGWELNLPSGTSAAPTNPAFVDLYAITTLDNTNFANGNSGVFPQGTQFLCTFPLYPIANSGQINHQLDINLTPFRFIPLLHNRTGVTIPSGTSLNVSFYNRQVL